MRITKFSAIFIAFAFAAVVSGCQHNPRVTRNDNNVTPPKITRLLPPPG